MVGKPCSELAYYGVRCIQAPTNALISTSLPTQLSSAGVEEEMGLGSEIRTTGQGNRHSLQLPGYRSLDSVQRNLIHANVI